MAFTLAFPKINISGENAINEMVMKLAGSEPGHGLIIADSALEKLGLLKPLCEQLDQSGLSYTCFNDTIPNPTVAVVDKAYEYFMESGASYIIAFGGGSAIDTAKAVKILSANPRPITDYTGVGMVKHAGVPLYAINTTAGTAAEVTSNAVITDEANKVKCVIIDSNIIPDVSVNDPSIMLGLPADVTAATGMDALTHAVEAYVSVGAHILTNHSALESVRLIAQYLPHAVEDGSNVEAREMMALGQFLAGMAFNSAGLGMVHAMAHPAGAHKNLPHGVCNAILLPIVCEFNRPHRVAAFAKLAVALGCDVSAMSDEEASIVAVNAIRDLNERVGIPRGFSGLGVTEEDVKQWVASAMADPCAGGNPVAMTADEVLALYMQSL
ncbi:iron-containing alcohol dehydrogenase [Photobacterium sp. ZSDE20]|uniref:Iron-containing alcohol dehydrogenase n=1 Tax=Photobacterium pectinilyticum TaxID=2906793 RepID=A0ABT1N4L3_9GAMM|nr:iron-containing alcohol dehydrogenase [Photobacterium sp. ZSDE20]MCQ1059650.1 iron-containing alcohol dehydrogenase [Photobacterium sp. ZSDE20]MDD1825836.1 iron-containing alcohol dehydrogenase [Photobacterium sp. ZSDE20]